MTQCESTSRLPECLRSRCAGLILMLTFLVGTAWLSGASFLLKRHLWMDEVHSWLIISDPDAAHAMQALAHGVDFNPPGWFAVTRWISQTCGPVSESRLRWISLTWMLLAASGLYVLLSRYFSPQVSLIAVLMTAAQPLLIHQSTEIRFYGFWCALSVWLCNLVAWSPASRFQLILQTAGTIVVSATIAASHYFGILSLLLIAVPLIASRLTKRSFGSAIPFRLGLLIIGSGAFALACCIPVLSGQKAALSRPTWISAATISDTVLFLQTMLPSWQLIVCIAGMIVSAVAVNGKSPSAVFRRVPEQLQEVLPCLSLSAMPLLVVLVSWTLQPALVTRYAVVGLLATAPILALLLHQCSRTVQSMLCLVAIGAFAWSVNDCMDQWKDGERQQAELLKEIQNWSDDSLIVFEDRIEWMPMLHHHPSLAARCRLIDFSDPDLTADSSLRIVQRDVARQICKWYPAYEMQSLATLQNYSQFYVVPYQDHQKLGVRYSGLDAAELLPKGIVRLVMPRLKTVSAAVSP